MNARICAWMLACAAIACTERGDVDSGADSTGDETDTDLVQGGCPQADACFCEMCILISQQCLDGRWHCECDCTPGGGDVEPPCTVTTDLDAWLADEIAMDCGEVSYENDEGEWQIVHDCILARSAAELPFRGVLGSVGVAGRTGDPFERAMWIGTMIVTRSACTAFEAVADCTPGPHDPCLVCVDQDPEATVCF